MCEPPLLTSRSGSAALMRLATSSKKPATSLSVGMRCPLRTPFCIADIGLERHLVGNLPHQHGLAVLVARHRLVDVAVEQLAAARLRIRDQFPLVFLAMHPALAGHKLRVGEIARAERPDDADVVPVAKLKGLVQGGVQELAFLRIRVGFAVPRAPKAAQKSEWCEIPSRAVPASALSWA